MAPVGAAHPSGDPLTWDLELKVGRVAYEHEVEILARPGSPAGHHAAPNKRTSQPRSRWQKAACPRKGGKRTWPADKELLIERPPRWQARIGANGRSRSVSHRPKYLRFRF